jgi:ubiquinone/menaquinone biosynthesis C-methylase UbiE
LSFLRLFGAIDTELHGADLINGEIPHFPVASGKAQAVFVNYTLHQLTHAELAVCIAEFRRILRQGGILLMHEPCGDEPIPPSEAVEVLEDGSWLLKKHGVVNWNLTRDQLSKMMHDNFNVLTEERIEEDGKPKVVFILENRKVG